MLRLGNGPVTPQDLARFPIITFSRKTKPYEAVRELFDRPELPPIRLHASTSLATVIHMAIEGLNVAVIPAAIVDHELADGLLQLLDTDLMLAPLTFTASWLASPDVVAAERVADLARQIAQSADRGRGRGVAATVSRYFRRLGLNRIRDLEPTEPERRYVSQQGVDGDGCKRDPRDPLRQVDRAHETADSHKTQCRNRAPGESEQISLGEPRRVERLAES